LLVFIQRGKNDFVGCDENIGTVTGGYSSFQFVFVGIVIFNGLSNDKVIGENFKNRQTKN